MPLPAPSAVMPGGAAAAPGSSTANASGFKGDGLLPPLPGEDGQPVMGLVLSPNMPGMKACTDLFKADRYSQNLETTRSLQLKNEARYKEIEHFTEGAWRSHFYRMCQQQSSGSSGEAAAAGSGKRQSQFRMDSTMQAGGDTAQVAPPGAALDNIQGRIQWQEDFDLTTKRMMIDFELSEGDAKCRLNHLDRLHDWFKESGGKQARKAEKAPNYLTTKKNDPPSPGSARSVQGPLSSTAVILAGSVRMRKSARLCPEEIVAPMHRSAVPLSARGGI